MAGRRVCVLGDLLADVYLMTEPTRISREAPVMILREKGRELRPGGAGNAAANVAALGGVAVPVGLVGDDEPGLELRSTLEALGAWPAGIVQVPGGPTITKTRVVAGGRNALQQQVLRIDRAEEWNPPDWARDRLHRALLQALPGADAVLIADYVGKVVDTAVLSLVRDRAAAPGGTSCPVVVDTRHRLGLFRRVGMPTPNQGEVEEWLGRPLAGPEQAAWAALELCRRLEVREAVITRGDEGLMLALEGDAVYHVPAMKPARVYDVTGAGDTVAAVLALARAAGGSPLQAAVLAAIAGGIVVRKPGTATVSPEEMLAALEAHPPLAERAVPADGPGATAL